MIDFFLVFVPFLLGVFLVGRVMDICEAKGLVDKVKKRSSHKKPTARGAGLLFLWLVVPFSLFYLSQFDLHLQNFLWALTLGSVVIAWLGWKDDQKPQPAWLRLLVQILTVSVCVYFLPQYFSFWPEPVEKTLLVLAWVWFVNLYNFMDGLDGFAAGQAIFLAFALSILSVDIKPILLVLVGTTIGMMRLNAPPAKIFMGDVGSTYLGFVLGGFMFYVLTLAPNDLLWPLLALSLLFTADATYTLIKRTLQGKKPWEAHKEHWYQRAHQLGFTHRQVLLKGAGINLLLLIFVILGLAMGSDLLPLIFGVLLIILVALRIRYLERDKK